MVKFLALAFALTLPFSVSAQTPKAKSTKKRPTKAAPAKPEATSAAKPVFVVHKISIEGNKLYPAAKVAAATGLKIGEPGSKEKFDAARNKLIDTGRFAQVAYRYGPSTEGSGYDVTFEVAEVEQVYPVRFEDLGAPDAELRKVLSDADPLFSSDKLAGTEQLLKSYADILQKHLKMTDKITARVISEGPNELNIVFRPVTAPLNVAAISFTGNKVLSTTVLQNAIAPVAVGVPFSDKRFAQILEANIRPLYEARGRLRVAFPKVTVTKAAGDINGLNVAVEINEGESYKLGQVTIVGVTSSDALYRTANFKTDDIANFTEINAGVDRVKTWLRGNGYLKPDVKVNRTIRDEKHTVNLKIDIDPGMQYTFNKLTIEGLDLETEPAIRKMWGLRQGQPFNAQYPQMFLDRVREEGIFDNLAKTKQTTQIDEIKRQVDVTLIFTGGSENPDQILRKKKRSF